MSVMRIVFTNFTWVDLVIILLAAANAAVFAMANKEAQRLFTTMHQTKYTPSWRRSAAHLADSVRAVDEEQIVAMRDRAESFYSAFINITAIFPLLGILGTVVSLLPMVSELADMQTNFFAALTSTFWGLVFAIIFKLLDGFLSSRMEDNDKAVNLLLERRELLREGREG